VAVKPVAAPAKVGAMDKAKPAATEKIAPAASSAKPVKADGTPDMRYKENQKTKSKDKSKRQKQKLIKDYLKMKRRYNAGVFILQEYALRRVLTQTVQASFLACGYRAI
jgi:hypothetical protein